MALVDTAESGWPISCEKVAATALDRGQPGVALAVARGGRQRQLV